MDAEGIEHRIRGMARSVARKFNQQHDKELMKDIEQAGRLAVVAHGWGYLTVRRAMVDEVVYWLYGVTAGQRRRNRPLGDVEVDVVDPGAGPEATVMARQCAGELTKIASGMRSSGRKQRGQVSMLPDAMRELILNDFFMRRGFSGKAVHNARQIAREVITEHMEGL